MDARNFVGILCLLSFLVFKFSFVAHAGDWRELDQGASQLATGGNIEEAADSCKRALHRRRKPS